MEKRHRFTADFNHDAIRLLKTSCKPAVVVARELQMFRTIVSTSGRRRQRARVIRHSMCAVGQRRAIANSICSSARSHA